jgi:hypothetical protein
LPACGADPSVPSHPGAQKPGVGKEGGRIRGLISDERFLRR